MEGKGILHRKSEEWGGEGRRFGKVVETSDRVETSKRHSRWSEQTTIATKCHVLYMSRGKLGRAAHHQGQKTNITRTRRRDNQNATSEGHADDDNGDFPQVP